MKEVQDYNNSFGSRDNLAQGYPDRPGIPTMNDVQNDTRELAMSSSYVSGSTMYVDYPPRKPFINTDFTRTDRPVNTQPASDRDAVITALRQLQDKMKMLEVERTTAEKNLQSLTSETGHVLKDGRLDDRTWAPPVKKLDKKGDCVIRQTKELDGQLSSVERRCQLLEHQLLQMKQMVDSSERNQRELMEKLGKTRQERDIAGTDMREHMERLNQLERDQLRLTKTQTIAETLKDDKIESKIRQLEKKVKDEKIHRQIVQERTARLESATDVQKVLFSHQSPASSKTVRAPPTQVLKTKKTTKKKKKVTPSTAPAHTSCRPEPMKHYRLNLAEIPFVAGKSTNPSHSLGANVQKVLAMMKLHNNALCSQVNANGEYQRSESSSPTDSNVTSAKDLSDLLAQLEDEFGQLSSKHQEIMDQIHMARDVRVKEKLEQELDMLVAGMESKSQQISTIRHHQKKIVDARKVRTPSARRSEKPKRPHTATSKHHNSNNISSRHKPKLRSCNKPIGNSALGKPALFMLRDMKKLQTTLRRDDACWE